MLGRLRLRARDVPRGDRRFLASAKPQAARRAMKFVQSSMIVFDNRCSTIDN
jgi:hypothetical protein